VALALLEMWVLVFMTDIGYQLLKISVEYEMARKAIIRGMNQYSSTCL